MTVFAEDQELDVVTELLEKAEVQGYLTADDVLEAFPEAEENLEQLEEVFSYLIESGIEIYEDKAEAEADEELKSREEGVEVVKTAEENDNRAVPQRNGSRAAPHHRRGGPLGQVAGQRTPG